VREQNAQYAIMGSFLWSIKMWRSMETTGTQLSDISTKKNQSSFANHALIKLWGQQFKVSPNDYEKKG
jgi:hypothetical protein